MAEDWEPFEEEEAFHPIGTLIILAIFLVLLVTLWMSIYLILLSRGTTI